MRRILLLVVLIELATGCATHQTPAELEARKLDFEDKLYCRGECFRKVPANMSFELGAYRCADRRDLDERHIVRMCECQCLVDNGRKVYDF